MDPSMKTWNEKFEKKKQKIANKAKFKVGEYIRVKKSGFIYHVDDIGQDNDGNIQYFVLRGGSMVVGESGVEAAPPGTYGECLLI